MKTIILSILLLNSMVIFCQNDLLNTGVIIPSALELMRYPSIEEVYASGPTTIPYSYDLTYKTKRIPIPLDQGNSSSCTACALSYILKTFQEAEDQNYSIYDSNNNLIDSLVFSPSYLFKASKRSNDISNCMSGTSLINSLVTLETYGSIPYSALPFDANQINNDCSEPNEKLIKIGQPYRIYDFHRLSKKKRSDINPAYNKNIITRIKKNIFYHNLVIFASYMSKQFIDASFTKYSKFDNFPIWDDSKSQNNYHAMVIVGYNDTLKTTENGSIGAFKIINSWHDNRTPLFGIIWMSYETFEDLTGLDIYVTTDIPFRMQDIKLNLFSDKIQDSSILSSNSGVLVFNSNLKEHHYSIFNNHKLSNLGVDNTSHTAFISVENTLDTTSRLKLILSNDKDYTFSSDGNRYAIRLNTIDNKDNSVSITLKVDSLLEIRKSNKLNLVYPILLNTPGFDRIDGKAFRFQNIFASLSINGLFTMKATQANNRMEGWHGRLIFEIKDINGNILTKISSPSYGQNGAFMGEIKQLREFDSLVEDENIISNAASISVFPIID